MAPHQPLASDIHSVSCWGPVPAGQSPMVNVQKRRNLTLVTESGQWWKCLHHQSTETLHIGWRKVFFLESQLLHTHQQLYNWAWFIWISYEENKTQKPLWLIFWSLQMSPDLGHLFYKLFPVTMSILHRKQTELFVLLTSSIKLMKHFAEPSLRQWRKPKVCGLVL